MWIVSVENEKKVGSLIYVDVFYWSLLRPWKKQMRRAFSFTDAHSFLWLDSGSDCPQTHTDFGSYCRVASALSRTREAIARKKYAFDAQTSYLLGVDVADVD